MTLMQLLNCLMYFSLPTCQGRWWVPAAQDRHLDTVDQLQPTSSLEISFSMKTGDAAFLCSHLCSLQLFYRTRGALCSSPACSTPFPSFRRDCFSPSSNSKTRAVFPSCPVFQVRFVELLLLRSQMEPWALPSPSPPLPLLSCG